MKIIIEVNNVETSSVDISTYREQFIAFANFAKSYQSSKKVEQAWEQWLARQSKVCDKCGDTGRCGPATLDSPDGRKCNCFKI